MVKVVVLVLSDAREGNLSGKGANICNIYYLSIHSVENRSSVSAFISKSGQYSKLHISNFKYFDHVYKQ